MVLIIYEIMSIPFRISFDVSFSDSFDNLINAIFFADILISFNTGIYFNGELVYNRRVIALSYFKMWFWLDLSASFPYELIIQ